jgi:hypothetical protein
MNLNQKRVIAAGTAVAVAMRLYPPWVKPSNPPRGLRFLDCGHFFGAQQQAPQAAPVLPASLPGLQ